MAQSSAVCIPEIHRTLESGADVFLTFHAVYHTDKFGDFYSPVDGEILRQLPPPDKFLTLIDDIGDVAHRLREEGQVFSTRARVGLPSVREAIRDLLTILEWRAMEFTVSRLLGTFVGATPFLLAVKHPSATATRILLGNGVPSYVSHSISDSRRQVQESGSWPGFMTEVQLFTDALAESVGSGTAIPVVPTAIDELRIRTREVKGEGMLLPLPLQRWGIAKGELLVDAPPEHNWLDPRLHFGNGLATRALSRKTLGDLREIQGLLHALYTRIDNQINARDHTLVTQCPVLIVYREYDAWRVSDGVAAEIAHRKRLAAAGAGQERRTIFVHEEGDDLLRRLGAIVLGMRWFSFARGAAPVDEGVVEKIVKKGLAQHRPASFSAEDMAKRVAEILRSEQIEITGPWMAPGKVKDARGLGPETAAERRRKVGILWDKISESAGAADSRRGDLRPGIDAWIEEAAAPEGFAKLVNEALTLPKAPNGDAPRGA